MGVDDPWQRLLRQVARQWPPSRWRDLGVVIGCSGGADSVSLVSALASLRLAPVSAEDPGPRGFLLVAHFNHRLRGTASDRDQEATVQLAERLGLPWRAQSAQSPRPDEASMREERMRFLVQVAHASGARYIALAHSADDNVETVLHHLFRGTGPAGLAGIGSPRSLPQDLVLVRPLLHTRRPLIRTALASQGIAWCEDASNENRDYQRNWIRHELIPLIESRYPNAVEAVGRAIDGQRQWRTIIEPLAEAWLDEHEIQASDRDAMEIGASDELSSQGDALRVTLRRDRDAESAIVIAAVQQLWSRSGWPRGEMTQRHWLKLAATIGDHRSTRYSLPAGIDVIADGKLVTLGGPRMPDRQGT